MRSVARLMPFCSDVTRSLTSLLILQAARRSACSESAVIGLLNSCAASAVKRASRSRSACTRARSRFMASTEGFISCGMPSVLISERSSGLRALIPCAKVFKGLRLFQSTKPSMRSITGASIRRGAVEIRAVKSTVSLRSSRFCAAATCVPSESVLK